MLIVDTEKIHYPGDILHEESHLATMPPAIREKMCDTLITIDQNQRGETMALAWSCAATQYLGIDPYIVFHADDYKEGAKT